MKTKIFVILKYFRVNSIVVVSDIQSKLPITSQSLCSLSVNLLPACVGTSGNRFTGFWGLSIFLTSEDCWTLAIPLTCATWLLDAEWTGVGKGELSVELALLWIEPIEAIWESQLLEGDSDVLKGKIKIYSVLIWNKK